MIRVFSAIVFLLFTCPTDSRADSEVTEQQEPEEVVHSFEETMKKSVDFRSSYTGEVFSNLSGGLETGTRYLDKVDLQVEVDLERWIGWRGASAFFYGLGINGSSISQLVGDVQGVSNIEAPKDWKVYEAWIQQRFAQERGSVLVGLYDLNSEFDVINTSQSFINSSHGIGSEFGLSGRSGPSIFPYTSAGIRFRWQDRSSYYVQAALLEGTPRNLLEPIKGRGALVVTEIGHQVEESQGTRWGIGFWAYSGSFPHVDSANRTGNGNGGVYGSLERSIPIMPSDGPELYGFVRVGRASPRFNLVSRYLGTGLVVRRFLINRPSDEIGVALAKASLSEIELPIQSHETVLELTYRIEVAKWLTLQPDLQFVINPGGSAVLDDAVVFGLRFEIKIP